MILQRYRRWLTTLWWLGGGVLIALMLMAGINGQAFAKPVDGLDWLLPHIVPTMALTGAVAFLGGSKTAPAASAARGDLPFLFRLAMGVSAFYLIVVSILILTSSAKEGALPGQPATIIATLAAWNSVLAVLQGLVASTIGIFFARN